MDSRLLNAYHDDPYEVNYDNFDSSAPDIWSTDNIGIGSMELTDTLDGILPIAATETEHDICSIMFDDNQIYDDKEFISIRNPNALVYNDFEQQQLKAGERVGTIDTGLLSNVGSCSGINNFGSNKIDMKVEDDARSQCSEFSFRTRTDSSSIADYESHTSDYDDDEDEDDVDDNIVVNKTDNDSEFDEKEFEKEDILTDLPGLNILNTEDFMFTCNGTKQRTISTNTIGSDVDAMNFDLADFITNDDVPAKPKEEFIPQPFIAPIVQVISSKLDEDDSDSDVIVDVETVESEEAKERALLLRNANIQPEDNLTYVDNVKEDPSWSPKEMKSKPTLLKKQSDMSKSGTQRGKCATSQKSCNNSKVGAKKQMLKSTLPNVQKSSQSVGIGKGGKNLALLKRDCESIEDDSSQVRIKEKDIALLKHDSHRIDPRTQSKVSLVKKTETEKRKLNLDEYKRRHEEDFNNIQKMKTAENKSIIKPIVKPVLDTTPQTPTKVKLHSDAVTSIVKSLKEEQSNNIAQQKPDPITLAKNKVLRMQELKKAQQMKIIESTISAKVPRVTKLLPLQEIIKDTAYAIKNEKPTEVKPQQHTNPNYVKIVMVSASCNTALSLSPSDVLPNVPLLDNITRVTEHVKISNNSLITSIQDAVVKQSIPKLPYPIVGPTASSFVPHTSDCSVQHGEDKVIMHLRKDRIRGPTRSIAIQTDFQAAFPTLPMPEMFRKSNDSKNSSSRREYRKRKISSDSSSSSSSENDDNNSDHEKCGNDSDIEYIRTKQQIRNNGCIASTEYQNSEAAVSVGGYSSRSSRRHRSSVSSSYSESGHQRSSRNRKRKSSYRKSARKHSRSSSISSTLSEYSDRSRSRSRNRSRSRSPYYRESRSRRESSSIGDRNVSKPAVEERRIVYVGRIEEETSREMLRRKFSVYGSIKQITIHYKETGMKYGFVTFERSQDAFAVIDNSTKDSQINMYDISFGGRRAFCRTSYADLDNAGVNNYHSYVFPKAAAPPKSEDSFEALLQKVKAKLDANKTSSTNKT